MDVVVAVLAILFLCALVLGGASIRVVTQFERGVVLRFGRLQGEPRNPGLTFITPVVDRMH
jgi:regulator of protease activity HflC (stomatin/prohibitin superfamily)